MAHFTKVRQRGSTENDLFYVISNDQFDDQTIVFSKLPDLMDSGFGFVLIGSSQVLLAEEQEIGERRFWKNI